MPRPNKLALHLLRSLLLLTLFASAIQAQLVATGRINGIVTDQAGAALPGARVKVTELQTNQSRSTVSNESGEFFFPILPVGEYTVETELTGFQKNITNNIKLTVKQTINLELALQVGEVSQTIEVSGATSLLESTVPTLKSVIDQKKIQELPIEGRNVLKLMLLVPGVVQTGGAFINQEYTAPNQVFVSSNGGRGNTIVYNLDGVDNSDTYTNVANSYPNPDALQAITIETNSYSAEHGRRGGGVLNAITRSGSNSWHGSLFEFVRNSAFNATNFFTPGVEDGFKRHQFGGTIGGPIFKDKTFFFASYQRTTYRRLSVTQTATVPTAAQRMGDFSNLRGGNGQVIIIRDPNTGQPFPNNQIPSNRISPISRSLLEFLPVPDNPAGLVRLAIPNVSDDDQFLARVDHNLSNSNRLTGRVLYDRLKSGTSSVPSDNILIAVTRASFRTTNISISDTQTFSPRLIGVFSATLNRLWSGKGSDYPTTLAELGADITNMDPGKDLNLTVGGFFNVPSLGDVTLVRNNYQFQGAFTYVKGNHEIKFGADVIRQQFNVPGATLVTDGLAIFTALYSGSNLSDFMLGRPNLFIQATPWSEALRAWQPGTYFQDNYKVTPRLTINAGLRYDPYLPWKEKEANKILVWKPGVQSQVSPGLPKGILVAGESGTPEAGHRSSWTKFAPRLGVAYLLPNEKTSVRGGYGVFFDYPNAVINNRHASNVPFVFRIDVANPTSLQSPWTPAQPNPFPVPIPVPSGFPFPLPATAVTYSDDFTNGYMQQWNLTGEHQLTSDWVARVSYIGSRGVKLMSLQEYNPARYIPGQSTIANTNARRIDTNFASVQALTSDDTSNYNAIAFSAERRFRNDYTVTASYTFGKARDYQSNIVAHGQSSFTNPFDRNYDYALSDFDRTHRFVGSFLYQLPSLNNSSTPLRLVAGGWQLNSIVTLESGTPFTVISGSDRSLDGVGADRPNLIGDPVLDTGRPRGEQVARYFNTAAFQLNDVGTFGTAGRNLLRGPGNATVDFSVLKNFDTPWFGEGEDAYLQFRVEAFNLFNRANFANPVNNQLLATFGRITAAGEPRILQFGLRFVF